MSSIRRDTESRNFGLEKCPFVSLEVLCQSSRTIGTISSEVHELTIVKIVRLCMDCIYLGRWEGHPRYQDGEPG